jgi:adenine-specific DNA-methyltransferase
VKGFVPTPKETVDLMVNRLFLGRVPRRGDSVLDPGCGQGEFIEGVIRWCRAHQVAIPKIVGIESNPKHVVTARARFAGCPAVEIRQSDFLRDRDHGAYEFIVGNPPYVPITELSEREKRFYRERFSTAIGRFDLYLLFFEQALQLLKPGGCMVFVTPEKFLYVETAATLRKMLASKNVEEVRLIDEATFEDLVTYPTITTLSNQVGSGFASVILRSGEQVRIIPPSDGSSWLPAMLNHKGDSTGLALADVCLRISCGVATGADEIFVKEPEAIEPGLRRFAYPTIAGREMGDFNAELRFGKLMLIPYDLDGDLLPENKLGSLKNYLAQSSIRSRLEQRTCARRKPWYAFHETPPLRDILRPKILCKDITAHPKFWVEHQGKLVPRHSVYYIVPRDPAMLDELCDYLNSTRVADWLDSHCQRVANGFLRLQSHVLKQIPLPTRFADASKELRNHAIKQSARIRREDVRTRQLEFGR